jgi:hypothetical protein
MKKPDEEVGDNIIAELKKQKLLSKSSLDELRLKLVAGTLSSQDWKFLFETDRPAKDNTK